MKISYAKNEFLYYLVFDGTEHNTNISLLGDFSYCWKKHIFIQLIFIILNLCNTQTLYCEIKFAGLSLQTGQCQWTDEVQLYPLNRSVQLWPKIKFKWIWYSTTHLVINLQWTCKLIMDHYKMDQMLLMYDISMLESQVCIVQLTSQVYVTKPLYFQNWKINNNMKFWASYYC